MYCFVACTLKEKDVEPLRFHSPGSIFSHSPYRLLYSSYDGSLENLVWDQLIIPQLIFLYSHHKLLDIALKS